VNQVATTSPFREGLALALLWLAVLASALAVVYSNHLCRKLYAEMAQMERQQNSFQVEWGRYLLEQSTWASLARVEKIAQGEYAMQVPGIEQIVIVE